ncbi:MAG TPA: thiamine pyrophosphate-dependent enzyme, partial [bacterium]|nr:thiamine pyrophosphate-dependent enzyme [bacterium]
SLYKALADLHIEPHMAVTVSGIGCSGRIPGFVSSYGIHTVHGRALTVATGVKIANPELQVFALGGDGDAFAIGGNHLAHTARRNPDLTYIIMDNEVYGLTKGQFSPTTHGGWLSKTDPYGELEGSLNPGELIISYDTAWYGRGYSGKPKHLTELIKEAIAFPGFSVVHVISPCPTFRGINYMHEFNTKIAELPDGYDPTDKMQAYQIVQDRETWHLGCIYKHPGKPTVEQRLAQIQNKAKGTQDHSLSEIFDAMTH